VAWIGSGTSPAAVDASNQPTWFNIPFTDARTNKEITLADFRGKTVIVQSMGIGCVPCTEQQHRSAAVLPNFSTDQVAYISLDVVPGQDTAQLMTYANENSFPWTFATNTANLLRTLIQKFGLSVVNIDSVPLLRCQCGHVAYQRQLFFRFTLVNRNFITLSISGHCGYSLTVDYFAFIKTVCKGFPLVSLEMINLH